MLPTDEKRLHLLLIGLHESMPVSLVNDPVKLGMVIVMVKVVLIALDLLKNSLFNFPPDNILVLHLHHNLSVLVLSDFLLALTEKCSPYLHWSQERKIICEIVNFFSDNHQHSKMKNK